MSELIEPVEVPQSDFPHSTVSAPGMITLPADVLFVQGSAWFPQNLGQELPALADFARRGHVMAIVEYRPGTACPPIAVLDLVDAFLREHLR
ncbi:MAG TPA: hypothetical protein VEX66_00610 [Microlunatus sp.]|jgi:hypothetical protein|nr:hypothetical protein [Microlunatus sp.]